MQNTKKIGIIVKDLSPSYLSFCLIDMINKQVEETPDYDFIIFYENRYPNPLDVLCSTMSSSEIWNFDGVLISTPAGSTAYNLSVHGPILNLNSKKLAISPISPFRPRMWNGKILSDKSSIHILNLDQI